MFLKEIKVTKFWSEIFDKLELKVDENCFYTTRSTKLVVEVHEDCHSRCPTTFVEKEVLDSFSMIKSQIYRETRLMAPVPPLQLY